MGILTENLIIPLAVITLTLHLTNKSFLALSLYDVGNSFSKCHSYYTCLLDHIIDSLCGPHLLFIGDESKVS